MVANELQQSFNAEAVQILVNFNNWLSAGAQRAHEICLEVLAALANITFLDLTQEPFPIDNTRCSLLRLMVTRSRLGWGGGKRHYGRFNLEDVHILWVVIDGGETLQHFLGVKEWPKCINQIIDEGCFLNIGDFWIDCRYIWLIFIVIAVSLGRPKTNPFIY